MKKVFQKVSWQIKAMKLVIYSLVGIVPLCVLSSHLFQFTTPKVLLIILGAILLALLYSLQKISEKETIFHFTWIHLLISLYILSIIISAIFGLNPTLSFFGKLTDGIGVNFILSLSIIACVVGFLIKNDQKFIQKLLAVSFFTSFIAALGTYMAKDFPSAGGGSTIGNTSYTGAYLMLNICFAFILFFSNKKLWRRIFISLGGIIIFFSPIFVNNLFLQGKIPVGDIFKNPTVLIGSANGALLGLVVSVFIIISLLLCRSSKKYTKYIGVGLITIFIISSFAVGYMFFNPQTKIHQTYIEQKGNNRFLFWDIAKQGLMEKPILGWGMNSYTYVFQNHFSAKFFSSGYVYEPWTDNPHNTFWDYAVSGGIVGLVAYLSLIGGLFLILFKISKKEDNNYKIISIGLASAVVGYFVQSLFIFDSAVPFLLLFVIIGCAIGLSDTKNIIVSNKFNDIKIGIFSIVILLLLIISFFVFIKPWQESKAWLIYSSEHNTLKIESNPQYISNIGNASDNAYASGKVFDYISKNLPKMNEVEKKSQIIVLTNLINNLDAELKVEKNNFRAEWATGQFIDLLIFMNGSVDKELLQKARTHFNSAIEINPNNALVYFDMAQTYVFENNFKDAIIWVRKGIFLSPEYPFGYKIAHRILSVFPDKDFETYINEMEQKWLPKTN